MSRNSTLLPDGTRMATERVLEAGANVDKQTVEALPGTILVEVNFSRPADTIAYAADDAVTNSTSAPVALNLAGIARSLGGHGRIVAAQMIDSVNAGTKGNFELFIFNGPAAPTPDNDNTAFTPTDAEMLKCIGKILFHGNNAFPGDAAANAIYDGTHSSGADAKRELNIPFNCDPTLTNLWALMKVKNAYTPSSAENFAFRFWILPG